jgi:hypothetical protein
MHQPDFYPYALRHHRLFESTDVDETRELISRVMQPHSLIPSGKASGRSHMDFVKIGKLGIGTIAFGAAMRVNVEAVHGYYLMMFCVSGEAEVSVAGRTVRVNGEQGILRAPGESFSALLSPNCEQLVMRIDPTSFSSEERASSANQPTRGALERRHAGLEGTVAACCGVARVFKQCVRKSECRHSR